MGFTDHDRDLEFGGVRYAAGSGVEGSEVESHFSFAVGGGEIAGALASEGLADPISPRGCGMALKSNSSWSTGRTSRRAPPSTPA